MRSFSAATAQNWVRKAVQQLASSQLRAARAAGQAIQPVLGSGQDASAVRAFALPAPLSSRLVVEVARRAGERRRETLADRSLNKSASVILGVVTPGYIESYETGKDSSRRPTVVSEDGLSSIQSAMQQHRSAAARATVRAVIAEKAAELAAENEAAGRSGAQELARLVARASSAGVRLGLSYAERKLAADTQWEERMSASLPSVRTPPPSRVAGVLAPLRPDGRTLRSVLAAYDAKETLRSWAKSTLESSNKAAYDEIVGVKGRRPPSKGESRN